MMNIHTNYTIDDEEDRETRESRRIIETEQCDESGLPVHPSAESNEYVEDSLPLLERWKRNFDWNSIFNDFPGFTLIVIILLWAIHYRCNHGDGDCGGDELNCQKFNSSFNLKWVNWHFYHNSLGHLIGNTLLLLVYGWAVESILGFFMTGLTFFSLCYFITKVWLEKCKTNRNIIGVSGVIAAFGSIAICLTIYRLTFIFLYMKKYAIEKIDGRQNVFVRILFYSLLLIIYSISVPLMWINDLKNPDENTANDIHHIGYKLGFIHSFLLVFLCVLNDFLCPLVRRASKTLDEMIYELMIKIK